MSQQQPQIVYVQRATNGAATAALVCGLVAIFVMPLPFFIGVLFGFLPALSAIIFGIIGHNVARRVGVGFGRADWGTALGVLAIAAMFIGGGTIW